MRGCSCGAEWGGHQACHCGECHRTFSSLTWFDRHRRGGTCTDPAGLGMRLNKRECWTGSAEWPRRAVAFSEIATI